MPNKTAIEWTATHHPDGTITPGYSSNPIIAVDMETGKRGWHCVHASPGCQNCYAETLNKRFGTGRTYTANNDDKVEFRLNEKELEALLRIRKPAKFFIGDMMDLFHEDVPLLMLEHCFRVFLTMIRAGHTIQILTKRAERMATDLPILMNRMCGPHWRIPPRLWLGTSVEDQRRANERIFHLMRLAPATLFLSVEPMLEAVDPRNLRPLQPPVNPDLIQLTPVPGPVDWIDCLTGQYTRGRLGYSCDPISWVICGGESGPDARPFGIHWARALRDQCKATGVAFFMKQLGARPFERQEDEFGRLQRCISYHLKSRKGGDMAEWPEDLRVREFPEVAE